MLICCNVVFDLPSVCEHVIKTSGLVQCSFSIMSVFIGISKTLLLSEQLPEDAPLWLVFARAVVCDLRASGRGVQGAGGWRRSH